MVYNLKDHVKGFSYFQYYREGALWYKTDTGFLFPVLVHDAGTASFNATEKSLLLMRWMRPYINSLNSAATDADTITVLLEEVAKR